MKKIVCISILVLSFAVVLYVKNVKSNDDKKIFYENFKKIDAELNEVYQQALNEINKRDDLSKEIRETWINQQRIAQRAWIKFRDEDTKIAGYKFYHGSGIPLAEYSWKIKLTKKRIEDLKDRYELN